MQSIYLHDEVKIEKKRREGIEIVSNLRFLPIGEGNIAYKAAHMLIEEFSLEGGVRITLNKHIPVAAGLRDTSFPSKFAVNGTTISLARELGPKGIRVNAVAPGITETDMMKAVPKNVIEPMIAQIPLRRLGQPEDIANAFVFLASDEASYITGVVLSVDGMARA